MRDSTPATGGKEWRMDDGVRLTQDEVLWQGWATLRRAIFDLRRRDGTWQTQERVTYESGNGAAILPYDPERGVVLLIRQFRWPTWKAGRAAPMVEAIAGLLDGDAPEDAARREAQEEAGVRIAAPQRLFEVFSSPGSITERLTYFVGRYGASDRVSEGGGLKGEGEDIEVLEPTLDEALAMIGRGEIQDAKTIILLQHAKLHGLLEQR
ncbi:NUDIX domain-containing protein [Roseomonas sp. CCTCC AB2023176]|uniref:NUDIX domain-containing protein n=1 Tax=Roseomonas sp. CCTCC AB2023176 TaxID=3342640 RepID=UPI0035E0FB7B